MEDTVILEVTQSSGTGFTIGRTDRRGLGSIIRDPLIQNVLPHLDPEEERKLMMRIMKTERRREKARNDLAEKRRPERKVLPNPTTESRKREQKILPKTTGKIGTKIRTKRRAKSPSRETKGSRGADTPPLFPQFSLQTNPEVPHTTDPEIGPSGDNGTNETAGPSRETKHPTPCALKTTDVEAEPATETLSPQSPAAPSSAGETQSPPTDTTQGTNGEFQLARKTARHTTPPTQTGLQTTQNPFAALMDDAENPPAPIPRQTDTQRPKNIRLPPIVATFPTTYKDLYTTIKDALGGDHFQAKSVGGDTIKLTARTLEDYNTIKSGLKQRHPALHLPHRSAKAAEGSIQRLSQRYRPRRHKVRHNHARL
ncbi:uncharacterized protein LOC126161237 [Schistocerca cancellata]|uniref:uncharacterized protein LOC126161237 n=1 Tax=Schistocerca cancellata TaxID=274614 RepID=UPI0021187477|nr:uncharacterized protein LOC126161237 [Schistocerca cancellata]